jgi:hypothetical protein
MNERKFYLFAETPRAGKYNHRFLVPDGCDTPSDLLLETYIPKVRDDRKGKDFVGVSWEVKQIDTNRIGKEILVLAAPYCDLSPLADQLFEHLKSHQDELTEIVTEKIDWNKIGADNLSIACPELADWQKELEPLLRDIKPNPPTQKGNWIMRHKVLSLIIIPVLLLVLFVVGRYTVAQWLGNLNQQPPLSNFGEVLPLDPRTELLEKWTGKMQNKNVAKLEQHLDKLLAEIPITYPSVQHQQMPTTRLQQKLQVLSEVLEIRSTQPMENLDDFLHNEALRAKVIPLYQNKPINPFMNVRNQYNEVEGVFLQREISLERAREIIDATIDFYRQRHVFESKENESWLRFVDSLIFRREDEQRWEIIKKYNPQWFTPVDVELSKAIFSWLTNDDAKAVLPEGLVNNYAEVLQQFAKAKIEIETKIEGSRRTIGPNSKDEEIKMILRMIEQRSKDDEFEIIYRKTDKNKAELKNTLQTLQNSIRPDIGL